MTRFLPLSVMMTLVVFVLSPFAVLGVAAGAPLPLLSSAASGMDLGSAVSAWQWSSVVEAGASEDSVLIGLALIRTLVLSLTVAWAVSTCAILGAYVATRWRWGPVKLAAQVAPLLAYSLPSVFLIIAAPRFLPAAPALAQVWILHFVYLVPLAAILAVSTCLTIPKAMERSAALEGGNWIERFRLVWSARLRSTHLGILCISALVSWSDLAFSNYYLREDQKLVVDFYVLRYFEQASSVVRYDAAALFGVVLAVLAMGVSFIVARTLARGDEAAGMRP